MALGESILHSPKIFSANALNFPFVPDSATSGITLPPALSVVPAPDDYLNLSGAGVVELLRDGDQNLPVMFSAATSRVVIDFAAATKINSFAFINHNCYNTNDKIKIYGGNSTPAANLLATLEYPNRSVDKFPLLRMNDAYVFEDLSVISAYRYWEIEFIKAAHPPPYVGEIFVWIDEIFSAFPIDQPGVDYANNLSLERQNNSFETMGGAQVNYDMKSMLFNVDLSGVDKPRSDDFTLFNSVTLPTDFSSFYLKSNKTVLIYKEDRTALFGRIAEPGMITFGAEKIISHQLAFSGELPNQFIIAGP